MKKDILTLAEHPTCRTHTKVFTLGQGVTHEKRVDDNYKIAFTLAEVLITLGIIGIVAAMTFPTLITRNQNKALEASLKKIIL